MAKYVIEIPYEVKWIQYIQQTGHGTINLKVESVSDLIPYAEPDEDEIRQKEGEYGEKAWQLFRNICELNGTECIEAFDTISCRTVLDEMTYSEAKAKYDEWKKQKDEICIGDEVKIAGTTGVVVGIPKGDEQRVHYITSSGKTYCNNAYADIVKTGRFFPEVAELLKKMGKLDD